MVGSAMMPTAVCTLVRSKRGKVRRSLSRDSVDVRGSVVMQKIWMFEGLETKLTGKLYSQNLMHTFNQYKHMLFSLLFVLIP